MPQMSKNVWRVNKVPPKRETRTTIMEFGTGIFFRGEEEYQEKSLSPELAALCYNPKKQKNDSREL